MGQMQGVMGHPGMGLFSMLLIGILAGWIAEKVTASNHGVLTNMLVGIAGALLGGKLAEVMQIQVAGFLQVLIAATIGAIILLFLWRALRGRA